MIQVVGEASSGSLEAQSVIAVFDDWESLHAVLKELADDETRVGTMVLFSPPRTGPPSDLEPYTS